MKALPCPGCGAPIAIKQGLASIKCSFCDLDVKPDFNTAPEFEGLDEKQYSKLKRRAFDSLKRDLYTKASLQFSTLSELLEERNNEEYLEIQALTYSVKLKEVLAPAYNLTNGDTLLDIKNQSTYAAVSAPLYQYVRIDAPMVDLIEEIEDKCDSLKKEDSILLAQKSFNYLYETLNEYIIPATNFILEGASYTETEEYGEFGNWINRIALAEPVYLAIKIRCEMFSMLMKFLELIDIGESQENPETSLKVHQESLINCFSDIKLNHLDLNQRHPYEAYNYKFVLEHSVEIREALERWTKLDDKLEPYFQEKEKREKEEEEKKRIEEEKIREQKKAEALQKAKEEKEKREKWLASPEYAALKKKRIKIFSAVFIVVAILGGGFAMKNFLMQDKNNSDSISIKF
tara:strand:+ start:467 stop:1675 length:1209 start_codon:yes stop_codon:yes gene_type:complete